MKVTCHAADMVSDNFRKFDYGKKKNLKIYGRGTPPKYDVSKIRAQVFIMYAVNDWTCTMKVSTMYFIFPQSLSKT